MHFPLHYFLIGLLSLLMVNIGFAQEDEEYAGDPLYREDQFFIGASYNLSTGTPSGFDINGFSGGLQLGFLRDMPVNEQRNVAIAIGGGLSYDYFGQNLAITETPTGTNFTVLESDMFDSNRLSFASVEAPIEFRWRSSTASEYRFWRIYAGFRVGYIYYFKSRLQQAGNNVTLTDIPELDRLQMGLSLSFGYNTVNFYGYYGLTPLFGDAKTTTGEDVEFRIVRVGLIFYIL